MERKIGEIFEYNGEWYQCVKSNGTCNGCVGKFRPYSFCSGFKECVGKIFKKLEKVGEPYIEHDHSMNKDVVVQDYKLYNQHACYNGYERILCFGLFDKDGIVTIKSKEPIKKDMEEKKLNLKPFDIQKAKEGKPVCTRDGRKARVICFDRDWDMHIVALVADPIGETVHYYLSNGKVDFDKQNDEDLMMLPEKRSGWAKVRKDINLYNTKEEADRKMIGNDEYVIAKVFWEE